MFKGFNLKINLKGYKVETFDLGFHFLVALEDLYLLVVPTWYLLTKRSNTSKDSDKDSGNVKGFNLKKYSFSKLNQRPHCGEDADLFFLSKVHPGDIIKNLSFLPQAYLSLFWNDTTINVF